MSAQRQLGVGAAAAPLPDSRAAGAGQKFVPLRPARSLKIEFSLNRRARGAPLLRAGWPPADCDSLARRDLILPAGTWVSVRVNELISTEHNRAGDSFTGTLAQPVVADGMVVARRGQTVAGRVAESIKGGRVKGTSRLAVELTEIGLVDGRQMPVRHR